MQTKHKINILLSFHIGRTSVRQTCDRSTEYVDDPTQHDVQSSCDGSDLVANQEIDGLIAILIPHKFDQLVNQEMDISENLTHLSIRKVTSVYNK